MWGRKIMKKILTLIIISICLKFGHTNNGGIMDKDGGNQKYSESQIQTIRGNL